MSIATPHFLLLTNSQHEGAGSAQNANSPSTGAWRFVLESVDGTQQFAATDKEVQISSERLDLLSVVRGLEALDQPSRVTLVTTSRYVARGMRFGLPSWRENGWQWEHFGKMSVVTNADLWQRVDQALQFHSVRCRALQLDGAAATVPEPQRAAASTRSVPFSRSLRSAWLRCLSWISHFWFHSPFQICPQ